ncbi:unnamed protein product [Chrysoparadoxa australica]
MATKKWFPASRLDALDADLRRKTDEKEAREAKGARLPKKGVLNPQAAILPAPLLVYTPNGRVRLATDVPERLKTQGDKDARNFKVLKGVSFSGVVPAPPSGPPKPKPSGRSGRALLRSEEAGNERRYGTAWYINPNQWTMLNFIGSLGSCAKLKQELEAFEQESQQHARAQAIKKQLPELFITRAFLGYIKERKFRTPQCLVLAPTLSSPKGEEL